MEKHHIEVMLPEEKVDARIREIGEQISREYAWISCSVPATAATPSPVGSFVLSKIWMRTLKEKK